MHPTKRLSLFPLALAAALLFSAMLPAAAFADDSAPPADPGTETGPVDSPPVEETVEAPAAPADIEEETITLPEVLDAAPEGTQVVVLDENNEPLPLVTEEAAEAILTGDPLWCPEGQAPTPGANGCTPGYGDMASLITELSTNAYSGNGTIWIESSYNGNDNSEVTLDGASLTTLANLTVQGGWNGVSGDTTVGAASTFDVALNIVNWTGDVTLNNVVIVANDSSAALVVDSAGDITVDDVSVTGNATGTGAYLDTCGYDSGTGLCTGTGDISVSDSVFDGNYFNGLVTDSAGNTTLTNVDAGGNGLNGAQITGADEDGTGNVTVTNGSFSNNTNGSGLDVLSDGSVTLTDVIADGNNTGALLDTNGDILISGGTYNNNDFDGILAWSAGNITLSGVDASGNTGLGAYLDASYGSGSILVDTNSTFTGNGEMGLKALTADGDITLQDVVIDGLDLTWVGAWLKSFDGGDILVQDSTFTQMTDVGLLVVTGGQVDLVNVTATDNGVNGVEVYSMYTYACGGGNNITVNVTDGTYTGNGEYGLVVTPGAAGTLNFSGTQTFVPANGLGDFLLDLADPDCTEKPKDDDEVPGEEKEPNVVDVPGTGGDPVEQDCEAYSSNILQLPDGTWVEFGCPFDGFNVLETLTEDQLPGTLGAGADFLAGLEIGLLDPDMVEITVNEDGTITITFLLPEDANARGYDILYWDPSANGGAGSWVTLPQDTFGGGSTALNPDDPTDGRRVKSGVRDDKRSVSVTVNFTGVFVLVAR